MFLDTFAWLAYLMGDARGVKVRQALETAETVYTCPMVIAEVTSKLGRTHDSQYAARSVAFIIEHAVVIDHTMEIGQAAGLIHQQMKVKFPDFGMADCFILAAARAKGVRVLTGDPHFRGLPDADIL